MRPFACLLAGLTFVTHAAAQAPADGRQVLERARAAIGALSAIAYESEGTVDGPAIAQVPPGRVKVVMQCSKLRVEALLRGASSAPLQVVLAIEGPQAAIADHTERVFIRGETANVGRALMMLGGVLIREFGSPDALAENPSMTVEGVGRERVGDIECDVVKVSFTGGEHRWWIATSDALPRRVRRFINTPNGESTITTTLTRLDLKPEITEATFRLEPPDGFSVLGQNGLLAPGSPAPDWSMPLSDGKTVRLKDLRGKVVLLDFWATWCGPCRKAMPAVQKLWEKYREKPVAVFGVNCWERSKQADPVAFMKSNKFTYPLLLQGNDAAKAYRVTGIPTFYLIGPDGKVLMASSGVSAEVEKTIEETIESVLKSAPAAGAEAAASQPTARPS